MTQAQLRFASFADYLNADLELEGRYEFIDGELLELPPESRINSTIAFRVALYLVMAGVLDSLIHPGKCEVQVPVLQPKDPANRFPDLVVLRPEHLELTQRRLTITLDMPPPQLVAEVVSPGQANRHRDYIRKRLQYAATGIPEYWLIDPEAQTVRVLQLQGQDYQEVGCFTGESQIVSPLFSALKLTINQLSQP